MKTLEKLREEYNNISKKRNAIYRKNCRIRTTRSN